jgi:phage/plasmid primase-like uncharacterized protein
MDIEEIEQAFSAAMAERGYGDHHIPANSGWNRFAFPDNRPGRDSGSAILDVGETIVGTVRDFRVDEPSIFTWQPNGAIDPALATEYDARARERAAEEKALREKVRLDSLNLFAALPAASPNHPYLVRKHIRNPHPLRQDGNALVVPIFNAATGEFQAIQRIWPDGGKFFPKGATVAGGCVIPASNGLERLDQLRDPIVYCEGYADAAAIDAAEAFLPIACLSSNNLIAVAEAIRRRFPGMPAIFAADDETKAGKDASPGIDAAYKAARKISDARVALPSRKDFSDVFVLDGPEEVKRQIDAADVPPPVERIEVASTEEFLDYIRTVTGEPASSESEDPAEAKSEEQPETEEKTEEQPSQQGAGSQSTGGPQQGAGPQSTGGPQQGAGPQSTGGPQSQAKAGPQAQAGPQAKAGTAPVDLWAKFDPPPLPADLLPATIASFATEQGKLMGADPAGLALAALTVCAGAVRGKIQIKVKRYGGWMESTRLWSALVGGPSSKKSPIIDMAEYPIRVIDLRLCHAYAQAKRQYDALNREQKRTAERPRHTRARIEDVTIEAAHEILQDSPDGVICVRDELSGWFGSMDKYAGHRGAANDRAFWLQAYKGGSYTFDRVQRGSGAIPNLSISLLGGIQPEPMREIATGTVDDGLIQRIIPIMMRPATIGTDAPISKAALEYNDLVERLRAIEKPFDVVTFDDGAMELRRQLEQKHVDLASAFESVNKKLAAHIGKYDGVFARLCLSWQAIESAERSEAEVHPLVISATAERVANFLHRFLLPHAIAFYQTIFGLADDHDRLAAVAGYILARKSDIITSRDVQRGDGTMRKLTKRDIEDVFHQLAALGWLEVLPSLRANESPRARVNPEVHALFAERGREEEERRRRAREEIAEALSTSKL